MTLVPSRRICCSLAGRRLGSPHTASTTPRSVTCFEKLRGGMVDILHIYISMVCSHLMSRLARWLQVLLMVASMESVQTVWSFSTTTPTSRDRQSSTSPASRAHSRILVPDT